MKNSFYFTLLLCFVSFTVIGQKLSINDLSRLIDLDLNNAETLLVKKKFEFKEVNDDIEKGKVYIFSFNLDKNGKKADEHVALCFNEKANKPYLVWYQLYKEDWANLKNALPAFGYKKTKTQAESDGSLSTEYTNSKLVFNFNSGKSQDVENNGAMVYTLTVMLK